MSAHFRACTEILSVQPSLERAQPRDPAGRKAGEAVKPSNLSLSLVARSHFLLVVVTCPVPLTS